MNYNVRYFLEQCLHTVLRASAALETECFVVDNASSDDSMAYLKPLFPTVSFVENSTNPGFARANNQVLSVCRGEYVLFLNPDTLLPEQALQDCLAYIRQQPDAGALGVRMVDGRGRFLPESKRAFPAPLVSLYKLSGLAALFPRSGIFNRYALGNLDEHANHRVDVLAGACMLVKRDLLLQLCGFDERYFLYGEDIDLSFRIRKAGYQNLYFAGVTIVHFKGESSGNNSLRHVKYFYEAMLVFVRIHYQTMAGKLLAVFLQLAIGLRAALAVINRLMRPLVWPLADGILVWLSLQLTRLFWIRQFRNGKDFGVEFLEYALPVFSLLFVGAAAFSGMYDLRTRISQMFSSLVFATLSLLSVYSLLPETVRFSRGVMLWGSLLATLLVLLARKIFRHPGAGWLPDISDGLTVVVASENDYQKALPLLEKELMDQQLLGRISPEPGDTDALGCLANLLLLAEKQRFRRVVFCVGDLTLQQVLPVLQACHKQQLRFLFHVSGSRSMVGSQAMAPANGIITPELSYAIEQAHQRRMKRAVDLFFSFVFFLTLPVHLLLQMHPAGFLKNIFRVLLGYRTWVGYASAADQLPRIRPAVLASTGVPGTVSLLVEQRADRLYARDYDWWGDIRILFRYYRQLGN